MTKRTFLIVPFVVGLFALIMAAPAAAQQAEAAAVVKQKAFQLYLHGRILQAARQEEAASRAAADDADRVSLEVDAVDMCATAGDWNCVAQGIDAALRVVRANSQLDIYRPRLLASWLRLQAWRADDVAIANYLHDPQALALVAAIRDPLDLAMVHLALHDWYARNNDLTAAERSLDVVRTALLRMDGRYSNYEKARVLVGLIQSLRLGKDISGAYTLALRVGSSIDKAIPRDSAVYAKYVFERAQLASYTHAYDLTAALFTQATGLIERLDIAEREKVYRLAIANGMTSAAFLAAGEVNDARAVHARHPLQALKGAILARTSFASMAEFYFAVSDVLIGIDEHQTPDQRWTPLFDKDVAWTMDPVARREFDAFRNFARGKLAVWSNRTAEGLRLMKLAARARLDNHDAALREGFEGVPLPSLIDMVIVQAGLEAASRVVDRDALGLMLAGSEVQWPTIHHTLVDAAVLLGSQDDAAARRDAKSYLELLRSKRGWEVDRLAELVANNAAVDRAALVRRYTDMVTALARLKDRLRRNAGLKPAKGLPTLDDVQRALAPGDAYVTYFKTLSGVGKLCITPSGVFQAEVEFTPSTLSDIKLLAFATTASYPANRDLDAQFPVSSALRLDQFLFGGLESCLRPGTHVIVTLPDRFAGVPLGALLGAPPPHLGEGYDLAKAHWLIRDLSFSRVLSARQYLATMHDLLRAPAPRVYLGIGDPRFDQTRVAQLASTAAVKGLASLPELPETAEELNAVATVLQAPATDVLLREAATEHAFRSKPLGEYNVLHIASHGLLAEDLSGLTEPVLVLTPVNAGDASDDGLLTASEIVQLSLNARLVVLSACNTAKVGLDTATSGVQDLHTAFTIAGAPTLLASLWPVESATARDIVVRFFTAWRSPQSGGAAETLARATRAYLDAADAPHQHPRFWAPFVVLGNGDVHAMPAEATARPRPAGVSAATSGR